LNFVVLFQFFKIELLGLIFDITNAGCLTPYCCVN